MKTLNEYRKCDGCDCEVWECFEAQEQGLDAGLEFSKNHLSFFVIDPKTGKFIVPYYN